MTDIQFIPTKKQLEIFMEFRLKNVKYIDVLQHMSKDELTYLKQHNQPLSPLRPFRPGRRNMVTTYLCSTTRQPRARISSPTPSFTKNQSNCSSSSSGSQTTVEISVTTFRSVCGPVSPSPSQRSWWGLR